MHVMLVSLTRISLTVFVNTSWWDYEVNNNFQCSVLELFICLWWGINHFRYSLLMLVFFASENINRFYLGVCSLTLTYTGYLIYRISLQKNHRKWSGHY